MINRLKSIIQRMAELRKICQLVSMVDEINTNQIEDDHKIGLQEGDDFYGDEVEREAVISDFAKKYDLSIPKARRLCNYAATNDYLDVPGRRYDQEKLRLRVASPKGYDLIQKRWGIPTGWIRAVLEENKRIVGILSLISAIVIGIATVINVIILASRP